MRTIWKLILFGVLLHKAYAQPGVTSELFRQIENTIVTQFGDYYKLDHVISVDSEQVHYSIPGAKTDRSDQSLKAAYIFAVVGKRIDEFTTKKGFVGVYKDNQIIWHSDTVINDDYARESTIEGLMDLNNDGKMEIITNWQESGGIEYLWIFSWNGKNGTVVNDVDEEGQSVIASISQYYTIIDINGDGVMEITGAWSDDPDVVYHTDSKTVYSWNGQKYGKWNNPPQPPPSGMLPRNKLTVEFKINVKKVSNELLYQYSIFNNKTSLQSVDDFLLSPANGLNASNVTGRKGWKSSKSSSTIRWTNMFWYGDPNYIAPNELDSSFSIQRQSLPQIGKCYVQGHNGNEYNGDQILINSTNGFTLTPTEIPSLFVPLPFLDTLLSYTRQSVQLGWLKTKRDDDCDDDERPNDGVAKNIEKRIEKAKKELIQGDSSKARKELEKLVKKVERMYKRVEREGRKDHDREATITSEAYALLKYNAEYLIERLPEKKEKREKGEGD